MPLETKEPTDVDVSPQSWTPHKDSFQEGGGQQW